MRSPASRPSSLLAFPLLALLSACGSPEAPELSLSGPSSAAVIWGDASEVAITLTRNETAIDAVTLSVEGLPEGVTATFEPATLPGDALAATLHLEAARDAIAASVLVTVRATGPEALVAEHAFALNVGGLTVEGSVETHTGAPLSRPITVKVGDQRVATDAQGHFVAHQVSVPYDVVLRGEMVTEIYSGLRTSTPVIRGFFDMSTGNTEASMRAIGTVSPAPAVGERVTVCANAARADLSSCATIIGDGSLNAYGVSIPLIGGTSQSGQIIARREVLDGAGGAVGFTGYAEATVTYAPGTEQVIDLVFTPSSSTPISYALASGGAPSLVSYALVSYGAFLNGRQPLAPDALPLPEGAQGAIIVIAGDTSEGGSITIQPVTGPLEGPVTFAPRVPIVSPVNGATLAEDVAFVMADPGGALVSHTFRLHDGELVFLHTFEARVEFAELASHVDGLAPADIEEWIVVTDPNITTPDQALAQPVGYAHIAQSVNGAIDPATLGEPLQMTISSERRFAAPVTPAGSLHERLSADLFQ